MDRRDDSISIIAVGVIAGALTSMSLSRSPRSLST